MSVGDENLAIVHREYAAGFTDEGRADFQKIRKRKSAASRFIEDAMLVEKPMRSTSRP